MRLPHKWKGDAQSSRGRRCTRCNLEHKQRRHGSDKSRRGWTRDYYRAGPGEQWRDSYKVPMCTEIPRAERALMDELRGHRASTTYRSATIDAAGNGIVDNERVRIEDMDLLTLAHLVDSLREHE